VKVLTPRAILDRLASGIGILQSSARDLPARQQTLRGAISWSYDLLDPGLQRFFHRFSVFRGGAALEQIESVCGPADEIGRDVLDGITELVDQSLVRQTAAAEEPRFLMHQTIREFGHEKLVDSGEAAAVELRHAEAYLALAERIAPELLGARQKELLDRLEVEQGNLRAALDACAVAPCAEGAACACPPGADEARIDVSLRLASALWRFWQMRGHLHEGRQRTERILSLPGAEAHTDAYLGALEAAGGVTYWIGDMAATEATYGKRLELARSSGDDLAIANALYDLSFVHTISATDIPRGRALLEQALALFRDAGDRGGTARALWALTSSYVATGEWQRALDVVPEVIRTFRETGNRFQLGWAVHNLGIASVRSGSLAEARDAFTESLGIFRESGDVTGYVLLLHDFAELAAAERRYDRALRLYGAGRALQQRTGSALADVWSGSATPYTMDLRALLDSIPADRRDLLMAEGATLSDDAALEFALSDRDAP
jgi:predicted ATPase